MEEENLQKNKNTTELYLLRVEQQTNTVIVKYVNIMGYANSHGTTDERKSMVCM